MIVCRRRTWRDPRKPLYPNGTTTFCVMEVAERTGNGRGTARQTVRGHAQIMSAKFLGFWAPSSPLSAFGPDQYYWIHAISLTVVQFWLTPPLPSMRTSYDSYHMYMVPKRTNNTTSVCSLVGKCPLRIIVLNGYTLPLGHDFVLFFNAGWFVWYRAKL